MGTLLAVGLGYSASAVAARLNNDGWHILGTARNSDGLRAIEANDYRAIPFPGDAPSPELREIAGEVTHLLISAPPGAAGDPLLRHHVDDLLKAPRLNWIGYLSTIGVYGDHQGGWVEETTPPSPTSQRSQWRLEAENALAAFASERGATLQVFRLAGIYGPGRNQLVRLLAGQERRIEKQGQVFNRTHVADIATVVMAGIRAASDISGIFNVADDEPAPPQDVIAYAAGLLGMEPPPLIPWEQADLGPMGRSFYGENKRVRNDRIKRDLGVTLAYPTYREGLSALAADLRR